MTSEREVAGQMIDYTHAKQNQTKHTFLCTDSHLQELKQPKKNCYDIMHKKVRGDKNIYRQLQ